MQKLTPALALLSLSTLGCGQSPGSVVLVFPDDASKAAAAHATFEAIRPLNSGDDECMRYLEFAEPDPNQVEAQPSVDLMNGVPTGEVKGIPTGFQTLLVKVTDANHVLILHGCRTGNVSSGTMFEVDLKSTLAAPPDLLNLDALDGGDGGGSIDMTMHRYLQITTSELRAPSRKLSGVAISITDSASTTITATPTDGAGQTKVDTLGLVPPLTITANAPVSAGYAGAVTLAGVNPSFTSSDTIAMQMPIELDPPATSATNAINVTVPDGTGQNFNAYFNNTNGVPGDQATLSWSGNAAFAVQPLQAGSYRIASLDSAANKIATPSALTSAGQSITPQLTGGVNPGDFKAYSAAFALSVQKSNNAAYTTQQYGVELVLPSSLTQVTVPIFPLTNFTTSGTVAPAPSPVPAAANAIQLSAVLLTQVIAFGPNVRGELRHSLTATATPANDAFGTPVPDPPTVSVNPATVMANAAFTITATPSGTVPLSTSFVHVIIHDTATPQKFHWHMIAPAANPNNIKVPANVVPAGTYAMDVSFVQDFQPLADSTVQATLTDDYTKLIRIVPALLCLSTSTLTVN